jgi:hypothetical protein
VHPLRHAEVAKDAENEEISQVMLIGSLLMTGYHIVIKVTSLNESIYVTILL